MRARPAPSTPNFLRAFAALALSAVPVAGCGAAAPAKSADPAASAAPVADADADQNELDRGEWRITELFGPPAGATPQVEEPAPSASGVASAAPTAPKMPGEAMSGGDVSKPADACSIACTALASMERAARHLCEMSGPDEPPCTSARERVRNANDRVAAHCTCGL